MWFGNKGVCVGMGRVRKVKGQRGPRSIHQSQPYDDGRMSRSVQVPLRSADNGLLVMNRAGGNWRRFQERGRKGAHEHPSQRS